jgi:Protein of unknown function (DUF2442)
MGVTEDTELDDFWISKEEYEAGLERGRKFRETVPHAVAARYDQKSGRIVVDLTNGATFAFFPQYLQGMEHGTPEQFAEVEVLGSGYGLHWETLDADFTVPGLLNGIFGTAKWMAQKAGQTTSPAKAAAARANGAKGGRPRKVA